MLERIAEIIKEQLNADGITITMDTSFEKDLEADSLDLFELVMTLEDEYGVEIPSEARHYRCGRRAGRLRVRTNPPGEGNGR